MSNGADDARAELLELVRAARALLRQHEGAGGAGLPAAEGFVWPQRVQSSAQQPAPASVDVHSNAQPTTAAASAGPPSAGPPSAGPACVAPPVASPQAPPQRPQPQGQPQAQGSQPGRPSVQQNAQGQPPAPQAGRPAGGAPAAGQPASAPGKPPSSASVQEGAQPALFAPDATRPPAAPPKAKRPDNADARLRVLADEAAVCTRCVLHQGRNRSVFSRGSIDAELCFVGEAPGADEDREGLPFVGAAGQLLDRMIAAMGMSRDEVYVANICKCRPPNNRTPELDEMASCIHFLHDQISLVQPRVIVALGATATKGLLSTSLGIRALRGTWKLYKSTIPLMPTYHPAYLLREPSAKRDAWNDLQAVLERLGRPLPRRTP